MVMGPTPAVEMQERMIGSKSQTLLFFAVHVLTSWHGCDRSSSTYNACGLKVDIADKPVAEIKRTEYKTFSIADGERRVTHGSNAPRLL